MKFSDIIRSESVRASRWYVVFAGPTVGMCCGNGETWAVIGGGTLVMRALGVGGEHHAFTMGTANPGLLRAHCGCYTYTTHWAVRRLVDLLV